MRRSLAVLAVCSLSLLVWATAAAGTAGGSPAATQHSAGGFTLGVTVLVFLVGGQYLAVARSGRSRFD